MLDIEEINISIAQRVRESRENRGLSQRELSRLCGISKTKVAMIEGADGFKIQHGFYTLIKICLALNIKLSDILIKIEKSHTN